MGRRPLASVLVAVALATAGACTGESGSVLRHERTGTIEWKPCEKVECASLSVPLDFERPAGPRISLALARLPAAGKRVGVLFTNPGGPGGSGVGFLRDAAGVFPAEIRDAFDLVSWDPRGVGASSPVRCLDDLDPFYAVDHNPRTAVARARNVAASRTFVDACRRNSGNLLPYVSTAATARDLDAIRTAMGETQISYVGFSYGTLVGAVYADLFPRNVRAMVLDGAIDPARSYADATLDQAKGFDDALDAFFAHCRADEACGFARGGDPAAAFDDLAATIAAEPVPATVEGEHRTLGPGELDIGVASALYAGTDGYADLAAALAQVARGAGDRMLSLADAYTGREPGGRYSNETAALYSVSCVDAPVPATVAAVERLAARTARVAPRFGSPTVWLGLPCTFWPVPAQGRSAPIRAPGAPPIVVVGTTHDPATPYPWAQALASELRSGRLLTVEGVRHTSYGGRDACVDDHVDRYLLELVVPPRGTRCG